LSAFELNVIDVVAVAVGSSWDEIICGGGEVQERHSPQFHRIVNVMMMFVME